MWKERLMFGTIGHAQVKPGHDGEITALLNGWKKDIRPKISGHVLELVGHSASDPNQIVFVALMQDESTYRDLAEMPEQDVFYRALLSHIDGDITWDDVNLEITLND
jgi:hypothetical protein